MTLQTKATNKTNLTTAIDDLIDSYEDIFPFIGSIPLTPNTYIPASGSMSGEYKCLIGGASQYTIPGIGPTPPAGHMYINASYADSGSGNISNIYSVVNQSGTRYATAITGSAVNTSTAGSVWGLAGIGIAAGIGSFCAGAQIEAEVGASGVNAQTLILSVGPYSGSSSVLAGAEGSYPSTCYISMTANPGNTSGVSPCSPYTGIAINDAATNPMNVTGTLMGNYSNKLRCAIGLDFLNATFTSYFLRSNGFSVDGIGQVNCYNIVPATNMIFNNGCAIVAPITGCPYINFNTVASANHGLNVTTSNGGAPILGTTGGDLSIQPATGYISYGTYSASALTATGYISIKDAGGTIRRVLIG